MKDKCLKLGWNNIKNDLMTSKEIKSKYILMYGSN
jgi:hypothetical protein